jgi:hypothetical protein
MPPEQKEDPSLLWLDSISSNLLKCFKENDDEDGNSKRKFDDDDMLRLRRELASLQWDRRDCWKEMRELEKEFQTETVVGR